MTQMVAEVCTAIRSAGDAERAVSQQRYMKSALPYRGISSPELRTLLKPVLAQRIDDRREWERAIRELYGEAEFREERYAAIALLRHRHYRSWRDSSVMALVRELIVQGAWWDLVDDLVHVVGEVRLLDPAGERERLRGWSVDENLWLRRASIISQLHAKDRTDTVLMTEVIDANLTDREFFIRKAIGWALREYARTDPAWVLNFVAEREDTLSGLSRREALKHLG